MKKCFRCSAEFEKLYMVPHVTNNFINTLICRGCSMDFHKKILNFTDNFLFELKEKPSE